MAIKLAELANDQTEHEIKITEEKDKRKKWKEENQRRKHNYLPLIFELMSSLARKNMLKDMYDGANEIKKKKIEEEAQADKEKKSTETAEATKN